VLDHRPRLVEHPPAAQPEAPAEVEVLVVHEEALVEEPGVGERCAPEQHARAAGPEHLLGGVVLARVHLSAPAVGAAAVGEQQQARVLDHRRALGEEQLGRHRRRPAVTLRGRQQRAQGARPDPGVGVQQHQVRRRRLPDGQVVGRREAQVGGGGDEPQPAGLPAQQLQRSVGGGVVDDHHLGGHRRGLGSQGFETGLEVPDAVVVHEHHGRLRGPAHGH